MQLNKSLPNNRKDMKEHLIKNLFLTGLKHLIPELRRQKAGRSLSSRPVLVNKTKFHARVESKRKQTNLFVNLQMASGVTYHLPLYFWLKRKDF